jgi:pepF/M3 family oligoendopeptidase
MERIRGNIASFEKRQDPASFLHCIDLLQEIDASLLQCDSFILCLLSQDTADTGALQLRAAYTVLEADFQLVNNRFDDFLVRMDPHAFDALISNPQLESIRFVLEERRTRAAQKLAMEKEDLITRLSIDGYHAWGDLYPILVREVTISVAQETLSFGQAENRLTHPDRKVREEVFSRLETAWKEKGTLFAAVLNHLAGFRLEVYTQRGWSDPLQEPLFENRMSRETLEAMWGAVEQYKKPLVDYMRAKTKLLHLPLLSWYDLEAPLIHSAKETIPYDQAAGLIIEHLGKFHPRMGTFAKKACTEQWIDAEDRPGKRPGGYCCSFPKSRQSRIFMTYSGSKVNIMTLAHELGHAWHAEMTCDLPMFAQHYRMNVAETASTFAEQIISDHLLHEAKTDGEKLVVLSGRIERSITFMMNIHARFLFETRFYQCRKKSFLSAEELCRMMRQAQEEAFCGELSTWHPWFWAAKLHFYCTSIPFYNFPYTFGYLFSLGMYAKAKQEGPSFTARYDALLRESGMMSVEDLAKKHLGVDLRRPGFWQEACSAAVADVREFLALSQGAGHYIEATSKIDLVK